MELLAGLLLLGLVAVLGPLLIKMKKLGVLVFLSGLWCLIDGGYSVLRYLDQPLADHTTRLARALVGLYLMAVAKFLARGRR